VPIKKVVCDAHVHNLKIILDFYNAIDVILILFQQFLSLLTSSPKEAKACAVYII
jgi:hypothetical protein